MKIYDVILLTICTLMMGFIIRFHMTAWAQPWKTDRQIFLEMVGL